MISLLVNNIELPLDSSAQIPFNIDSDYFNLEYIPGSHTYSFNVPFSKEAREAFGYEDRFVQEDNIFTQSFSAEIRYHGISLMSGNLKVQRISSSGFSVFVLASTAILSDIKDTPLPELFSIKVIGYNPAGGQISQPGYTPVWDLFVSDDFQQILSRTNEKSDVFNEQIFSVSATYVLEKLFESIGYTVSYDLKYPKEQYQNVMFLCDQQHETLYEDTAYDIAPPGMTAGKFLNIWSRSWGAFPYIDTFNKEVKMLDLYKMIGRSYGEGGYGEQYLKGSDERQPEPAHLDSVTFNHETTQEGEQPNMENTVVTFSDLPGANFVNGAIYFVEANASWYQSNGSFWEPFASFNLYPKTVKIRDGENKKEIKTEVDPVYMTKRGITFSFDEWNYIAADEGTYLTIKISYTDPDASNIPLPQLAAGREIEYFYDDGETKVKKRGLIQNLERVHSNDVHLLHIETNIKFTWTEKGRVAGGYESYFASNFRAFPEVTGDKKKYYGHYNHSSWAEYEPIDDYQGYSYNYLTATNYQFSNPQKRIYNRAGNPIEFSLLWHGSEGLYEQFLKRPIEFQANARVHKLKPDMNLAEVLNYRPYMLQQLNGMGYYPKKMKFTLKHSGVENVELEARVATREV
ncbi:hypothetical protein V6R21_19850 [Limibacter armeniacum]|uniref:hypothetical protein n=1 Tax=Limibacter armeniacum TaxID=466084 RepID=UPI002FE68B29